jgi:EmrB/QacA subfamily drug resistance transporter
MFRERKTVSYRRCMDAVRGECLATSPARNVPFFDRPMKLTPVPRQGDSEPSVEVGPAPAVAAEPLTSRQAFLQVFPGVMVAMFLAAADQTILASALPTIAGSLGGLADLSWVVIAYLLAATIAAPLYGHLGDRFGRRRMLLGALAIFTAASLACALAPTLLLLIAARAVQGLGGGGLMTLAQALIGEHVSPRERGRFSGYFATVFALASTSGPVLGAYLTEHLSWRAVFAVNLPLGLVAAILAWRIPQAAIVRKGRFHPDIIGALLFTISALALLFALSSGGNRFDWRSWPMAALIGGALFGFALLVIWERRAKDPVIPIRFFAVPAIVRSDAVVICFAAALFSTILYLPLYLQLGRGLGIGQSGLLLLPITLSMVVSSTITGRLVTRTGEVKLFPQAGLAVATLAYLLLAATVSVGSTLSVLSLTLLAGAGLGMVMPPTQVAVQHAAGRESLGAATATISVSRAVGGAIGVAIVGAILFAMLATPDGVTPAAVRQVIEGGPVYFDRLSTGERATLTASLDKAYRIIFVVIAGTTALGALVARTIPSPKWTA